VILPRGIAELESRGPCFSSGGGPAGCRLRAPPPAEWVLPRPGRTRTWPRPARESWAKIIWCLTGSLRHNPSPDTSANTSTRICLIQPVSPAQSADTFCETGQPGAVSAPRFTVGHPVRPTMKLPSRTACHSGGRRTSHGADQPPRSPGGSRRCWAHRLFEALRSAERPPDTTAQSQPDPRCDPHPLRLGRRAAALAAHREAAEGRGQGASRRGCGQGARQSPRASAARHRQGRHCLC
jgi:hypothetical protein